MKAESLARQFLPMFPAFSVYVMPGDFKAIEWEGFTIRATIHRDETTRPDEFDCYSPDDIAAWKCGEWEYVGVVLSVWVDDICLDDHAASLWGIDCNYPGADNLYLSECADDLLGEALGAARTARAKLLAKLK
jgi:hypothetical protein